MSLYESVPQGDPDDLRLSNQGPIDESGSFDPKNRRNRRADKDNRIIRHPFLSDEEEETYVPDERDAEFFNSFRKKQ